MITIQSGKLCIPDIDRFVGFAGDDVVNEKQFVLLNRAREGGVYTLYLRFDDDTVRTVSLTAAIDGSNTVLTWRISREQLYATGIVTAQLRIADSDGSVEHSTKDFFIVGSSIEKDAEDDDGYVTTSQLRNSINQALQTVSQTAPYIGEDGCWYVYDPAAESYVRTEYHVSGLSPDIAMSDSSLNPVQNKVIKQYADGKADDCNRFAKAYTDLMTEGLVKDTRTVAGYRLSGDIASTALAGAILPYLARVNVLPASTSGVKGQIGIGVNGEPYYCREDNRWERLIVYADLDEKMDLVEETAAADIGDVADGNFFLSSGGLYLKHNDAAIAVFTGSNAYTKAEIDSMIGDIESLLAAI